MTSRRDVGTLVVGTQLNLSGPNAIQVTGGALTLPTGADTLVGVAATQTLTNKTLTLPTISSINNGGTLTLPTGADTIVGAVATQTLTNKTLTAPKIDKIVGAANSTDVAIITDVASAVNQITLTNAITTVGPSITATGTDTNINLNITPKGTGKLVLDGLSWPTADGMSGQALTTDGVGNLVFASVPSQTVNMVNTTDATPTTIVMLSTTSNSVSYVEANIVARNTDDSSTGASYKLIASFKHTGVTLTQIGTDDKLSMENNTTWDVATSISGTDILIRVTGEAATNISWMAYTTKLMI